MDLVPRSSSFDDEHRWLLRLLYSGFTDVEDRDEKDDMDIGGEQEAFGGVEVTWDGPVLRLQLSRPDVRNALSTNGVRALTSALHDAARRDDLRVVALTAAGEHFCAGIDLTEANTPASGPRPRAGHLQRGINLGPHGLIGALHEFELPIVVGVRGWAAGLGSSLALLSDYIIASDTARFWAPFVGRGFTPDSGSTWLLPRLIGLPRAKAMILLSRVVPADKAEQWGMVSEVVADHLLEQRTEEVVHEFAAAATASVGLAKLMLHRHMDVDMGHALTEEALMEEVSVRSPDFREGIAALREHRVPRYEGR